MDSCITRITIHVHVTFKILREFCGKSDAAFGGCGFFVGARRQSVSFRGVCVTYGETLLLAVPKPSNYGKMVPLLYPMVKSYPPQGSYNSKIGEGCEVECEVTW